MGLVPKAFDPGKPRVEYVELGKLKKWPKNPKGHDLDAIGEFFKANGFAELPIVDEGTGKMVAGHGRAEKLEAMMEAGEPPPERVEAKDGKWFIPVIRGMRFRAPEKHVVASNRGVELGGWTDGLAEFLAGIGKDDLLGTGYTENNFASFMASASAPDQFPVVDENLPTDYCCPKCGHKWSGNPNPSSGEDDGEKPAGKRAAE